MGPVRGFAASSPVAKLLAALATAGAGEQKLEEGCGLWLGASSSGHVSESFRQNAVVFFFAVRRNGEVVASPKGRGGNK